MKRKQPTSTRRRSGQQTKPLALCDLANVGPATLGDFERLGIRTTAQLAKQEGFSLYRKLCRISGERHDPCVIDVFLATISQANGDPPRVWWEFTPERKAALSHDPTLAGIPKLKSGKSRRK